MNDSLQAPTRTFVDRLASGLRLQRAEASLAIVRFRGDWRRAWEKRARLARAPPRERFIIRIFDAAALLSYAFLLVATAFVSHGSRTSVGGVIAIAMLFVAVLGIVAGLASNLYGDAVSEELRVAGVESPPARGIRRVASFLWVGWGTS